MSTMAVGICTNPLPKQPEPDSSERSGLTSLMPPDESVLNVVREAGVSVHAAEDLGRPGAALDDGVDGWRARSRLARR
jgi:hypothetical protein